MSLKIDLKLVAVTCIFLGIFLGFYVDSSIISKPKIETLTEQVDSQQASIIELENELAIIEANYETIEAQYNEHLETNVPSSLYDELQEEASAMEAEITDLEEQVTTLTHSVESLQSEKDNIQDEYDDLQSSNTKLQERFDEIYNPGYVAFSYNDLRINLTVTKVYFESNTPIEGKVTVRYGNGAYFEGTAKLRITSKITKVGSPSDIYEVYGESEYSWSGAFISGAGSYKLSISELLDDQEKDAVPSTVLLSNYIDIFMG